MGFGEWLKKATTIPTKGALGGIGKALRPIVGENIMDEIGTVGGFLVGGPAGAGVGRAIGNGIHTQNLGKTLRAGAEGAAMGYGAHLLGVPGSNMAGLKLPGLSSVLGGGGAPAPVPGLDPAGEIGGGVARGLKLPGMLSGIGKFLGGNDGMNGLALAQMATGAMGAHQAGRAADQEYSAGREDMAYDRERQGRLDAERQKMMESIMAQLAARRVA